MDHDRKPMGRGAPFLTLRAQLILNTGKFSRILARFSSINKHPAFRCRSAPASRFAGKAAPATTVSHFTEIEVRSTDPWLTS